MTKSIQNREVGKQYIFSYSECQTDFQGWINSNRYRPRPFDLVFLKIEDVPEKILEGWWTGSGWDGAKITKDHKIVKWKKKVEHFSKKYDR